MTAKTRIILADDHPFILGGLREILGAQPDLEVVGEATTGMAALKAIGECRPDVAIVDISMPDVSGITIARRLKEGDVRVQVILLTLHEDRAYLRQALESGVRGFVLKRSASEYLLHAIKTILNGGVYIDPSLAELELVRKLSSRNVAAMEALPELTEREEDVLKFIALGLTHKEIASRLQIGAKSVETYKMRGLEKVGVKTRAQIVRYAAARGWLNDSGF